MRISKLISLLEAYKREHGDQHVKAYDRRGDEGPPTVSEKRWMRGGSRDKVHCMVESKITEDE